MQRGKNQEILKNFMRRFKSVKIMHDNIHRADFNYLTELFRFMGIFVCEDILVEKNRVETAAEKSTVYDACIYVGNRNPNDKELVAFSQDRVSYANVMKWLPENTLFFYEEVAQFLRSSVCEEEVFLVPVYRFYNCEEQELLLSNLFRKLLKDFDERNDVEEGGLDSLTKIYVENNLLLHSMNMQYFSRRPSDIIEESRDAFRKVHEEIEKLLEIIPVGVRMFYEYAKLWCEVKINNACDYLKDIFDFSIDGVAGRCRELINRYPDFSNAKILLGLSYEPSISSANEALDAYLAALRDIKWECFASSVYYWIGKRYETYSRNREDAERSFMIANERKTKFRNYFKLAVFAKDRKDYTKAIELFQEIVEKLEMKKTLEYVDPLELEYIFKSYGQQCYCYYQQGKYMESIKMGQNAEKFWEDIRNARYDRYFRNFYGVNVPTGMEEVRNHSEENFYIRYRDALLDRLSRSTVYLLLSDGYRKMLDTETADWYKERAIKLKVMPDYESEKGKTVWGTQMRK